MRHGASCCAHKLHSRVSATRCTMYNAASPQAWKQEKSASAQYKDIADRFYYAGPSSGGRVGRGHGFGRPGLTTRHARAAQGFAQSCTAKPYLTGQPQWLTAPSLRTSKPFPPGAKPWVPRQGGRSLEHRPCKAARRPQGKNAAEQIASLT
jgi:hypothetical protein